eukprot:gene3590-7134_t
MTLRDINCCVISQPAMTLGDMKLNDSTICGTVRTVMHIAAMLDSLGHLEISTLSMMLTSIVTFISCLVKSAPYGRYSSQKGWGYLINGPLAWFIMESPNLWMPVLICNLYQANAMLNLPNKVLLGYFVIHYLHRSILYPLRMPACAPMPCSVLLLAFLYCCWNGFTQSLSLCEVTIYPANWLSSPQFILGSFIFISGIVCNIHADTTLFALRRKASHDSNGIRIYAIPKGGLFEFVSCANYTAEIIEWIGFAIACWSLPATAFALFTFCNTAPRAYHHHLWYLEKFEDYPKHRKAVIPFLCFLLLKVFYQYKRRYCRGENAEVRFRSEVLAASTDWNDIGTNKTLGIHVQGPEYGLLKFIPRLNLIKGQAENESFTEA